MTGYFNGMILCWNCFEGRACSDCVGLTCQCPHTETDRGALSR